MFDPHPQDDGSQAKEVLLEYQDRPPENRPAAKVGEAKVVFPVFEEEAGIDDRTRQHRR